jgi:hypothetical protein
MMIGKRGDFHITLPMKIGGTIYISNWYLLKGILLLIEE